MKIHATRLATTVAAGLLILTGRTAHAGHVYAGIIDTNGTPGLQNGDALSFVDTSTTNAIPDGTALTGADLGTLAMNPVTNSASPQFGLFRSTAPTFTALSRGFALDGGIYVTNGNPFAASAGSFIELEIGAITGPNGATFSFWNTGATTPTYSGTVGGSSTGTNTFNLSDRTMIVGDGTTPLPAGTYTYPGTLPAGFQWNDVDGVGGAAPLDPFGHIHGRSFTADTPGTYTVSYVLKDTSGQQAQSSAFVVTYSTVPEPSTLAILGGGFIFALLARHRRQPQR